MRFICKLHVLTLGLSKWTPSDPGEPVQPVPVIPVTRVPPRVAATPPTLPPGPPHAVPPLPRPEAPPTRARTAAPAPLPPASLVLARLPDRSNLGRFIFQIFRTSSASRFAPATQEGGESARSLLRLQHIRPVGAGGACPLTRSGLTSVWLTREFPPNPMVWAATDIMV